MTHQKPPYLRPFALGLVGLLFFQTTLASAEMENLPNLQERTIPSLGDPYLQFYLQMSRQQLERRNLRTLNQISASQLVSEPKNGEPIFWLRHLLGPLWVIQGLIKQMVARTKRVASFNQRMGKKSSSSFHMAMIGVDGVGMGSGDGGDSSSSEAEGAPPEVAPAEVAPAPAIGTESVQMESASTFGDMNGDGTFDFQDAVLITQIAYGYREATAEELKIADLNQDGVVDNKDAMLGALVQSGVLTFDQIQNPNFDLNALLDENGFYVRQGGQIDVNNGTIKAWQVVIGNMSEEDIEHFMKRMLDYLEGLKKALAKAKGVKKASKEDMALLEAMVEWMQNSRQGKYDFGPLAIP